MNQNFRIKCRGIIISRGELLVVEHRMDAGFFALPGGHLEVGEDPRECIEREIYEELGRKPAIGRLLYINTFSSSDTQYVEFFFEIISPDEFRDFEKLNRSHAHELAATRWMKPTDEVIVKPDRLCNDFKTGRVLDDEVRFIKD